MNVHKTTATVSVFSLTIISINSTFNERLNWLFLIDQLNISIDIHVLGKVDIQYKYL